MACCTKWRLNLKGKRAEFGYLEDRHCSVKTLSGACSFLKYDAICR